MYKRQTKFPQH